MDLGIGGKSALVLGGRGLGRAIAISPHERGTWPLPTIDPVALESASEAVRKIGIVAQTV
jgi:hypothetical protein